MHRYEISRRPPSPAALALAALFAGCAGLAPAQVVSAPAGKQDAEPQARPCPPADQIPEGTSLMQHVWNRLIADYITAVRQGDVAHASVPHLPTLLDGLRAQEVIAAARRSEEERRWVDL